MLDNRESVFSSVLLLFLTVICHQISTVIAKTVPVLDAILRIPEPKAFEVSSRCNNLPTLRTSRKRPRIQDLRSRAFFSPVRTSLSPHAEIKQSAFDGVEDVMDVPLDDNGKSSPSPPGDTTTSAMAVKGYKCLLRVTKHAWKVLWYQLPEIHHCSLSRPMC